MTVTLELAVPPGPVAAHVFPAGLVPIGRGEGSSGIFTQMFDEAIGVLLTFRNAGQTGERVLEDVRGLIMAVIAAVAGWGPDGAVGVFRLQRGTVVSLARGTLVYELDFAISDQLRIAT